MVSKMNKYHISLVMAVGLWLSGCREVLEPRPIDILADQFVLNQASDVATVRLGAYAAFRGTAAPKVIVGLYSA